MDCNQMEDFLAEGIEFDVSRWRNTGISPENGQGLGYSGVCERFGCQGEFNGNGIPLKPKLVKDARDNMVCPVCNGSYGKAPTESDHQ